MRFVLLAFFASAALGQFLPNGQRIPKQNAVIVLANTPSAAGFQERETLVKTIAHVMHPSVDEAHSSFTVNDYAVQLGIAEWLLHATDKPPGWRPSPADSENPATREYHIQPGDRMEDRDPVARIYYLANATEKGSLIEIVTALRVVADLQMVFSCTEPRMLAYRASAPTVDLAEWMIQELDVPADGQAFAHQNQSQRADVFKLPQQKDGSEDSVRVYYLDPGMSAKTARGMVDQMRADSIKKVWDVNSPRAIVVRGNPEQLAKAARIIQPL